VKSEKGKLAYTKKSTILVSNTLFWLKLIPHPTTSPAETKDLVRRKPAIEEEKLTPEFRPIRCPIPLRRKWTTIITVVSYEFLSQQGKRERFMSPAVRPINMCLLASGTGFMGNIMTDRIFQEEGRKCTLSALYW
jgi:hypothetical protein